MSSSLVEEVASNPEPVVPVGAKFRGMSLADLPTIVAMERENYDYPWGEGIFRDCLRAGYHCRVQLVGDQPVAYGILAVAAGEAHVLNICVAGNRHRQGYGQNMVGHLLDIARKCNVSIAYLEVRPSNHGAIRLYQANGFSKIGVRKKYYAASNGREDALVLARHIN